MSVNVWLVNRARAAIDKLTPDDRRALFAEYTPEAILERYCGTQRVGRVITLEEIERMQLKADIGAGFFDPDCNDNCCRDD